MTKAQREQLQQLLSDVKLYVSLSGGNESELVNRIETAWSVLEHPNDMNEIPPAACHACGGWSSQGGMSQHQYSDVPVDGRIGCTCQRSIYDSKNPKSKFYTGE